ncbi:SpoIIE family protein phosphatase, partial [Streptomyces sp. NPDC002920]
MADEVAVALLDDEDVVRRWSRAATDLLGHTAEQACGRPVASLLVDPGEWGGGARSLRFRTSSGQPVELAVDLVDVDGASRAVLLSAPRIAGNAGNADEQSASLLRALLAQDQIGVALFDAALTVVRTNSPDSSTGMDGWPTLRAGHRLADVVVPDDADAAEALLRRVLETGVPLVAGEQRARARETPRLERYLSVSAVRLEDAGGRPAGVLALYTDSTEQWRARRRTEMSHEASGRIGRTLDVAGTAQEIADVLVPALADMATVEIVEAVLEGEEPPGGIIPGAWWNLRRVAVASAVGPWPADLIPVGGVLPRFPDVPQVRQTLLHGDTVFNTTRQEMVDILRDPELIRTTMPEKGHSAIVSPLYARGLLLGFVTVWRSEQPEAFRQEDADLLFDISSRSALSVDNARRYTREHRAAVALQQRLLPKTTTRTTAAESAGRYVPAGGGADISGDWFDVIPLPSLRVAFVVGDVIGHGLHAAATMGRLRTAIRTLADLELAPGELLIHLDDLVQQLADEADPQVRDTIGATCLYALYDPVSGACSMADAGHPPPVVIRPDGTGRIVEVSPGPPLGVGGMPFEVTTVDLEPGSTLALYTDGLVEAGSGGDTDRGIRDLLDTLSALCGPDRTLKDLGRTVMSGVTASPPRDDMALLLARTRRIPPADIAHWRFPDDPAVVADARKAVARQLTVWGLDELAFTTELIVSELVTNAIRHAGGTVGLRLFHDGSTLVCEVTDP